MKCPKCNKVAQAEWLYCPFCQNPLKEKCPECGEMERIGRKMCEFVVKEARIKEEEYIEKETPGIMFRTIIPGGLMGAIIFLLGAWNESFREFSFLSRENAFILVVTGSLLVFMSVLVGLIVDAKFSKKYKEKSEREFLRKFPKYAEILKKAEGDE